MIKIKLNPKKVERVLYCCDHCSEIAEYAHIPGHPYGIFESNKCNCKTKMFDTESQERFCYVINITKETIVKKVKETGEIIKIPSMLDVSNMDADEFINLTLTTNIEEKKGYYFVYDFDILSEETYKKISNRDDFIWFRHFRDGFQNFVSTIVTPYNKNEKELIKDKEEEKSMMLVNCTPHVINLEMNGGIIEIPTSNFKIKLDSKQVLKETIAGIDIHEQELNIPNLNEILPPVEEGVFYIVSLVVLTNCKDQRPDIVGLNNETMEREQGRVKFARGFIR